MDFINEIVYYFEQLEQYAKIYACAVACALVIIICIGAEILKKQAEIENKIDLVLKRTNADSKTDQGKNFE